MAGGPADDQRGHSRKCSVPPVRNGSRRQYDGETDDSGQPPHDRSAGVGPAEKHTQQEQPQQQTEERARHGRNHPDDVPGEMRNGQCGGEPATLAV